MSLINVKIEFIHSAITAEDKLYISKIYERFDEGQSECCVENRNI